MPVTIGAQASVLIAIPEKRSRLYLDSFDFDVNDPLPSQYHHLQEI